MRFGSACSGISSASAAWSSLGWEPVWFSEIDDFPASVLKARMPNVPNLGDIKCIRDMLSLGIVEAPDVFIAGTPCQSFSIAGMRLGLSDARGQLIFKYLEICDEIEKQRSIASKREPIFIWENVPGVLNSKDNAFGCLLGALAGEDCELQPAGKKWSNSGCVYGPKRSIAWRVLDAKYFGLAERRKRVFVVASSGKWFNPSEVLFEFEGVRRDIAPMLPERKSAWVYGRSDSYTVGDTSSTLTARDSRGPNDIVIDSGGPRRYTPLECERLQGFPDHWTKVSECDDDFKRYKAIGNSVAVNVLHWLGARIETTLKSQPVKVAP